MVIILATFLSCSKTRPQTSTCQPLTNRELEQKLGSLRGYNKRYQATTKSEAAKFSKLISQSAPTKAPTLSTEQPRGKRQALTDHLANLTRVTRRGSLDENDNHRLCTKWSAVTTLSADYYPRYLSEVICDAEDVGCLSNEGNCVQGSFTVDVLRNTWKCGSDGKQIWEVVSQPVRSSCICMLRQGSILSTYL